MSGGTDRGWVDEGLESQRVETRIGVGCPRQSGRERESNHGHSHSNPRLRPDSASVDISSQLSIGDVL